MNHTAIPADSPIGQEMRPVLARRFPVFCREVHTLLRAGMTIVEAIDAIAVKQIRDGTPDPLSARIRNQLEQGVSFSSALASIPNCPAVLVAAVRSGERTSNLVEALEEYLRFHHLLDRLRNKIISSAIYPAIVTGLGLAIGAFLLLAVLPTFSAMYSNLQGERATSAVMRVSSFFAVYRTDVLWLIAVLVGAGAVSIANGQAKAWLVTAGSSSRWLRARMVDYELALVFQTIALLLKGGYTMTDALAIAMDTALTNDTREAIERARTQVASGLPVSESMYRERLCDEVDRRLMFAAERNGEFTRTSELISSLHGEQFERFVDRASRVVEPVLLTLVALLVGSLVVAMYLPVFELGTQLR